MKRSDLIPSKILTLPQLLKKTAQLKAIGKSVVFTNGVFDLLHEGHIYSLTRAASEGDYLIVAINSDDSVKRLKGSNRPIVSESARALILASLVITDAVVIFMEDTPLNLIKKLLPDVLVKGGDYVPEQIAGAKEVISNGGRVVINKLIPAVSTTATINKISKDGSSS